VLHKHEREGATSVAIAPDSRSAASAGVDGTVLVSSLASPGDVLTIRASPERIPRALFSPNGARIAVPGVDGAVALFDARSGALVHHIAAHTGPVRSLAFLDDDHVLTGGDDGRVIVVDVAHETTRVLGKHAAYVRDVAPSPDRALYASLGFDRSVRVFDARTGLLVGLVHADAPMLAFAWSPRSDALALVGDDKLLDVVPRAMLQVLPVDARALAHTIEDATRARIDDDGAPVSARPLR
jgi:WD40 repeat protein